MIAKFSRWFDTLKEPKRFLTFLVLVFGVYVTFAIYAFVSDAFAGYRGLKVILIVLGVIQVTFFILVALFRAIESKK